MKMQKALVLVWLAQSQRPHHQYETEGNGGSGGERQRERGVFDEKFLGRAGEIVVDEIEVAEGRGEDKTTWYVVLEADQVGGALEFFEDKSVLGGSFGESN